MPVLPDKSSLDEFGGARTNAHPIDDPTTDVGAEHLNPIMANVAMLTHTAPRAWVLFTGATYTSGTVSVVPDDHDAVWGSSTAVRPTVGETSAGVYVVTWSTTQLDELAESHTLNIRFPLTEAWGVSTLVSKVISKTANTITINTYSAGVLNALNGTKIAVWWF